jgi:AbrB family looped-hinge helix DNA binding protein
VLRKSITSRGKNWSGVVRITSKGQVTIPQAVRERAGFLPNTEVEFILDGDLVMLVRARDPKRATRGALMIRHLRAHPAQAGMTTDEIMALTRGEE